MKFAWLLFLCLGVVFELCQPGVAQQAERPPVNIGTFARELLAVNSNEKQLQFAVWLPYEFFLESAAMDPGKTRDEIAKEMVGIKPYHTVLVECKADAIDGKFVQGDAAIRARIVLKLADGSEVSPVQNIPKDVADVASAMKQEMAQAIGETAENMNILFFPATTKDGKPIIDTQKRGTFTLVLKADKTFSEATFSWRTPFDALSTPVACPKCHELLSAKWYFCPWCGQKIE